jgi:hypothetical protein
VGRDNTGVHRGVKAGAHAQGPCFDWSKGAVVVCDGRDDSLFTPEHKGMLFTFHNLQVLFKVPSFRFLLHHLDFFGFVIMDI